MHLSRYLVMCLPLFVAAALQDFRVRVIRAGSSEYAELVLSAAAKADVGSTNTIAPPPSLGRIRNMFEWGSSTAEKPGRDPAAEAEDSREVVDTARGTEEDEGAHPGCSQQRRSSCGIVRNARVFPRAR